MFAYIKDSKVDIISSQKIVDISEEYIEKEYEWISDPFFDWENIIERVHEVTNKDIWDKILHEVFDWNPYAQLADLTKSQVTTLALLVPILGKETVRAAYSDLIATLEKVSQARVENWLSPFDLSFLD